ncbi:MAG: phospho-N-acetylmuramoyl-pentapeptide-transferase [Actinomycetota bacterium]
MLSLFFTPLAIRTLRRRGLGQYISEDGPKAHFVKSGTPTMGGLVIVGVMLVAYAVAHIRPGTQFTASGLLAVGVVIAMALVGFVDDYLKISRRRSLGLNKSAKLVAQMVVALGFGVLAEELETQATTQISFARPLEIDLGVFFLVWVFLIVASASNGVNLSDGLDGLASGSGAAVLGAYVVIAFWQFRHFCEESPLLGCYPQAQHSLDLALVAASMLGATAGFLWWNAAPAKIFMGDTGSLALGGAMAALAVLTNTHLLLIILGGLYVVEVTSVILQVISFRVFGRRIFLMAPIHHHFELRGWPEFTVIVRFWIVAAFSVGFGLGLFYADFIRLGGLG